jgi:MFS family permease
VTFSFRRLSAGVLLLNASSGVLFAVLPLFEFDEGGGPVLATLILGAPLLAQTLATFLWGSLSDRWGRRRELLVVGVLSQAALFLAYPFLDPVGLLLVRVVQVFLGATSTLATAVATEDPEMAAGRGLGYLSFWGGVGGVLGVVAGYPFLGGSKFTSHSPAAIPLFVLLAAFSVGAVVLLAYSGELSRARETRPWRNALRFDSGSWVARFAIATAMIGVANYTIYTLFPLFILEVMSPQGLFGLSANPTQQLALLSIGAGMGGVVLSPWTGDVTERPTMRRGLYFFAPILYAVLWTGFAFVRSYPVIFLIWAIPAALFFQIPVTREVAALTRREERGRAVGLLASASSLGGLGGAVLAGLGLRAGYSFTNLFLVGAALDLLTFAVLVVLVHPAFPPPLSLERNPTAGRESP